MPKDHFIAKTYLKKFVDDNWEITPYYKDGEVTIGKAKKTSQICYEIDGDTNKYTDDPRVLDKYLPIFENTWEGHVDKLREQALDSNTKFGISGYIAFLRACNPTAIRIGKDALSGIIQPFADRVMISTLAEKQDFDLKTRQILLDSVRNGDIKVEVDREYVHAVGITLLIAATNRYYCSNWFVMINDTDLPFITCDNPATLYYDNRSSGIAQIFVPLAPNMAVLIAPDLTNSRPSKDYIKDYKHDGDRFGKIKREYVKEFNKLIVMSAERLVLHSSADKWLEKMVKKYRHWRVESVTDYIKFGKGTMVLTQQRPIEIETSLTTG